MADDSHAEVGPERVVAHCVVLRVVPERRHRVVVVIAHRQIRDHRTVFRIYRAGELYEHVEQPAVICLLLIHVEISIVAGEVLGPIEPKWISKIEILSSYYARAVINRWSIREWAETRFAARVLSIRIGGEVVIE